MIILCFCIIYRRYFVFFRCLCTCNTNITIFSSINCGYSYIESARCSFCSCFTTPVKVCFCFFTKFKINQILKKFKKKVTDLDFFFIIFSSGNCELFSEHLVMPKAWNTLLEYGTFRRVISGTFIPDFDA